MTKKPIDAQLFYSPGDSWALKCSVCAQCGARAFPANASCMRCGSQQVTVQALPEEGTLWTYTIQRFMPKDPYRSDETAETFRPFGIGYVDLGGGLKIEARIEPDPTHELEIGMPMRLFVYTHRKESDGAEIMNYAFRPA